MLHRLLMTIVGWVAAVVPTVPPTPMYFKHNLHPFMRRLYGRFVGPSTSSSVSYAATAVAVLAGLAAAGGLGLALHATGFDPGGAVLATTALLTLQEKRAGIHTQIEAILTTGEGRATPGLTEDETRQVSELEAEYDRLGEDIAREERRAARAAELGGISSTPIRPDVRGVPAPETGKVAEFRDSNGDKGFGDFLHSVRFNPGDERLSSLFHQSAGNPEERGQSMGEGAEGGFAIPTQIREGLLEVAAQGSIFRPRATVIPAGSPPDAKIEMVALDQTDTRNMYGGVEVEWIAEGDEKPETDARIRQVILQPNEVAGHIVLTDKVLRNWQASGPLAQRLLRGAITAAEDHAFYAGNGAGKPQGVRDSAATIAVNRAGAGAITYEDVAAMYAKARHGGALFWVANQSILPSLMAMEDGAKKLVWQPNARDGTPGTLLGLPLVWNERSALLGAKGDLMLVDASYYLIKDGSGPFVAASEHVFFRSNKTVIKAFWNVDGQPWLTEPIKQEGGYLVSPFVALDVPS